MSGADTFGEHQERYGRGSARIAAAIEWPTVVLVVLTFAAWFGLTAAYRDAPAVVVLPLLIILLTFHSSLQHELVHGHPTRWHAVNRALGMVPLSLWLPFERYRQTHLVHHVNERLTDPFDDPESRYYDPEELARLGPLGRAAARAQRTFAGWIVVGSFWRIGGFLVAEFKGAVKDTRGLRSVWITHLLLCVPILAWLSLVGMPIGVYCLLVIVPSNGLLLVRSYCEHRARPLVSERTAIVENSWFFGPLFLFNNLHALHHEEPGLPWYRYPARYRERREALIAANGGLVYQGYGDVAQRFLWRAHDDLEHPLGRAGAAHQRAR